MRAVISLGLTLLLTAGCQTPPPDAYVHGANAGKPVAQVEIGKNSVGEACTQQVATGQSADVFCGTWQQPSARVRSGGAGTAGELVQLATSSPWRAGIDNRFRCDAPVATTILGGQPAELMSCTRLVGGWAHVAMVALVNGTVWYADGVLPAAQVMERSVGVLAGVMKADAAPPNSGADALLASRLAARAFGSGDIGQFDALIAAGTRANLADNPAAAESAFRAALALQQKALGKDNPNTATALMSLALQLSNEGRYAEADALFADATRFAPASADATAQARLLHYRGLDALNQGQLERALTLLTQADVGYAAEVPSDALTARPRAPAAANQFASAGQLRLADLMPSQDLITDPTAQSALLGLIEARRNRSIVLRMLDRPQDADAVLKSATDLARGNGLARPIVSARLYRTAGVTAAAQGLDDEALADLRY
jgi:tetratricopeptide (TPR) repeat protein